MKGAAAKQGDRVVSVDTHIAMVPGTPPVPTPLPHQFNGILNGKLSQNVYISRMPAAMVGSTAECIPHFPTAPGVSFQRVPANKGSIARGSDTVFINGQAAARNGDPANTCNDPADAPIGKVVAVGATVMIG